MKHLSTLTDVIYQPKPRYSQYEKFWLQKMNDKRDLPFIHMLTMIHLTVLPIAVFLFLPLAKGWVWWAIAAPYFVFSQVYLKGRFGLMFHCMCHRKMFKKDYTWIHTYLTWCIAPLFGHSPESYFSHHLGMHHIENNMPEDSSSTMPYQRDSIKDFLKYYLSFITIGFKETFLYLYNRKRKKLYIPLTIGELVFYVFCIVLLFINVKATCVVFIVPLFWGRLIMMLGNWTQHSFIDRHQPENLYTNSINCINTNYNKTCWNDGYHTIHHLRPGMHYTDIPGEFLKQMDNLAQHKAIVFDGIHYLHIFTYLMTKRYDKLAACVVNINNTFSNEQEVIQLMKERTRKINLNTSISFTNSQMPV